tara:strand:+ start:6851 stop:7144 length:294 start_codon:yes stop_codon:yes gene_type:complete
MRESIGVSSEEMTVEISEPWAMHAMYTGGVVVRNPLAAAQLIAPSITQPAVDLLTGNTPPRTLDLGTKTINVDWRESRLIKPNLRDAVTLKRRRDER